MISETTTEELTSAVELVAREVLWEAGVDGPPVDAIAVATRLGCRIVASPVRAARASRVRLARGGGGGRDVILLGPEDRPERRQWSAAHELGELCVHRVFDRLKVDPRVATLGARELAANAFANALLLPGRWFRPLGGELDWDLLALKHGFNTASHELIARRVLELHPGPIAVTVIDNGDQTWRRGNQWRPPAPGLAELEAWKAAHDAARPVSLRTHAEGVRRVRAWPVHEADWKREVVLTEFEDS